MSNASIIAIAAAVLVALFLLFNLVWRWASRRTLLPCPTALSWTLEGGFVDWWAATARTLDRIGLQPGDRVLEVGPGPGRLLIPAAARVAPGGVVVGVDVQPGMIARLRKRAGDIAHLTVKQGNGESLPVESSTFDVVYMAMVLGEIPDREAALRECFRALKNGGRLSITEMAGDPHFQSQATVERLASAAGFARHSLVGHRFSYTANFVKPRVTAGASQANS